MGHFLPVRTNSLILANILLLPRGLPCSLPFLSVSTPVGDIMNIQHKVAVVPWHHAQSAVCISDLEHHILCCSIVYCDFPHF
ncbi:hypothetical protein F4604DRAFT_1794978 [Suillus subluteus]|nr:hypothetical protein F4604DRAFT_1794978 [Suillus subluteus]